MTLEALYRVMQWSFVQLYMGTWPERAPPGCTLRGPAGQRLAGRWTCAFAGLKGDAKFIRFTMHWRRRWGANNVCFERFASKTNPTFNYLQLQSTAGWRFTTESHEDYMRNTSPQHRSPLFEIPGFRKDMIYHDLLHTVCLGIGQDFAASCLVELAQRGAFGREFPHADLPVLDAALHEATLQFARWCSAEGLGSPSFDTLTATALGWSPSSFPSLPGKGSDCRMMLMWLASVCSAFAVGKGEWEQARGGMFCVFVHARFVEARGLAAESSHYVRLGTAAPI